MNQSEAAEKVKKLLAVALRSSIKGEAEAAILKARELIVKYKLDISVEQLLEDGEFKAEAENEYKDKASNSDESEKNDGDSSYGDRLFAYILGAIILFTFFVIIIVLVSRASNMASQKVSSENKAAERRADYEKQIQEEEEEEQRKRNEEEQRKAKEDLEEQEAVGHYNQANIFISQRNWLQARDSLNTSIQLASLQEAKLKLEEIKPQIAAAEESKYKSECVNMPYKQLNKEANRRAGEKVHFYGEIKYISETEDGTEITVNVTKKGSVYYTYWVDAISIFYNGYVDDIYADDFINVWGEINSKDFYTKIDAKYISK